jgi:hypothetical protein
MLQRLPFQQLHGDERLPLELVNVVNRANVRVIERTRGARLALEASLSAFAFIARVRNSDSFE